MLEMGKMYVVFVGRNPGVYMNWEACQAEVSGFPKAIHCKFDDQNEASTAYSRFLMEKEWLSEMGCSRVWVAYLTTAECPDICSPLIQSGLKKMKLAGEPIATNKLRFSVTQGCC